MSSKILILDNIRSAHNVGSLFRTADGAGVEQIILAGYTPAPKDRFGRENTEIKKTSLSATDTIPWESVPGENDLMDIIKTLKNEGWSIVAVEQTTHSISLYDFKVPRKVVYILGNEIDGVSPTLVSLSETVVNIPMSGKKESLNVSAAGGIVLFHR